MSPAEPPVDENTRYTIVRRDASYAALRSLAQTCQAVLESLERNLDPQYLPETRAALRESLRSLGLL